MTQERIRKRNNKWDNLPEIASRNIDNCRLAIGAYDSARQYPLVGGIGEIISDSHQERFKQLLEGKTIKDAMIKVLENRSEYGKYIDTINLKSSEAPRALRRLELELVEGSEYLKTLGAIDPPGKPARLRAFGPNTDFPVTDYVRNRALLQPNDSKNRLGSVGVELYERRYLVLDINELNDEQEIAGNPIRRGVMRRLDVVNNDPRVHHWRSDSWVRFTNLK